MSKQISVKSIKSTGVSIKQLYEEANTYLDNIGFTRESIFSLTEAGRTVRIFMFTQGEEKILLEYHDDIFEEILKLVFEPMDIKFVYDILLMRFNQIAKEKEGNVFIYNS